MRLFGRKRRSDAALLADPEARSPQLGVKNKDLFLLNTMTEQGADLREPRHVMHYSYFPSAQQAAAAGAELAGHGWTVEQRDPLPDYPGQWSVVADRHAVVLWPPDFVVESTELFESVAARHGGEYDGWEASL